MSGQTEIMWGEVADTTLVAHEITNDWKEVTLADVVSKLGDGLHGTPKYDEQGEYAFINGNNLLNGKIVVKKTTQRANEEEYRKHRKDLNERTILVSINGTLGNVALYNNEKCILGKSACYFNVLPEVDRLFIKYVVTGQAFQEHIRNFAHGTTIQNVSLKTMREYPFLLPSLPEQRSIADVLSSLDDKIDLLHRQNATLEALAETLFRQWFVEEAKEEWDEVTVGDYVRMNDESIGKGYTHSIINYLDTGSITEGKIDAFQTLTLKEAPSRARRLVKHNDILISTVRPDQRHYGIIKSPVANLVASTGFCVLSCQDINPHFIYCLLTADEMIEYMHSIAEGSTSTYPSLKPSDIAKIEFKLPPKEMMDSFAAYADDAWDKIESNYIQIRTLSNLRDTLLPKLMSGEVRVAY